MGECLKLKGYSFSDLKLKGQVLMTLSYRVTVLSALSYRVTVLSALSYSETVLMTLSYRGVLTFLANGSRWMSECAIPGLAMRRAKTLSQIRQK
jgi:hypothetical protein